MRVRSFDIRRVLRSEAILNARETRMHWRFSHPDAIFRRESSLERIDARDDLVRLRQDREKRRRRRRG